MNFTIDVGNTNIMICCFLNKRMKASLTLKTCEFNQIRLFNFLKSHGQKKKNANVIVSSVVPKTNNLISNLFKKNKISFYNARDLIKHFDLKTNIKNKKNIGDDRLVNVIYAKELYSKSKIIIDFGTATTIDILDKDGVYDGGIITPGIDLSLKSLQEGTAKLPLVRFRRIKRIVGKSTLEAIQSGFFWGYVSMIQGLIKKIQNEKKNKFQIILTGGNSKYFKGIFTNVIKIDEFFNSKGLNFLISNYLK